MKTLKLTLILFLLAPGYALAHGGGEEKSGHPEQMKIEHPEKAGDGHGARLGQPGNPERVSRTVTLEASDDMRYTPSTIRVKPGETVRIRVTNVGKLIHETVLGTKEELEEHAAIMRKFPQMEHEDPNQVVVKPGETGELVWQFTRVPGNYDFACLVPGHYEAGMAGKIIVE